MVIIYFITTLINAYLCSLIWQWRAKRNKYTQAFDQIMKDTEVGQHIATIATAIEDVQKKIAQVKGLDKDGVVADLWHKLKSRLGGTQKALNLEMKELETAVATVVQVEYPGCMWMSDNIDLCLTLGLVDEKFKEGFLKAAENPRTFEMMEKVCLGLKHLFEGKKGQKRGNAVGRPQF